MDGLTVAFMGRIGQEDAVLKSTEGRTALVDVGVLVRDSKARMG